MDRQHIIIPVSSASPLNRAVHSICVNYDQTGIASLTFNPAQPPSYTTARPTPSYPYLERFFARINDYLLGRPVTFQQTPLSLPRTATPFRKAVWSATMHIPYGAVATYGQIAERVSNVSCARAVGAALSANPLPLVIPCHRVIGANGSLGGFGPGLPIKRALLALEGSLPLLV